MINVAMNMNEIIIRDVNLLFNVEKFSKEFAKMCVTFLINFFSEYDQVILIEKFRDLTAFIISLSLLRMTQFSQNTINSMTQFVQIIIEIFRKYIIASRYRWHKRKKFAFELRWKRNSFWNSIVYHEACSMTERSACELRKDELHDIRWKISILYVWTKDCWFCLRLEWQIFWNCKDNKNSWMIFLSQCFESSGFH